MVGAIVSRYFFDVRLFHPHLHAGFSRRFRSPRRYPRHRLSARRVSAPQRDSRGTTTAPTSSPRRGELRCRGAPEIDCALNGDLRASPSGPPARPHTGLAAFNVDPTSTSVLHLGFAFSPSQRSTIPLVLRRLLTSPRRTTASRPQSSRTTRRTVLTHRTGILEHPWRPPQVRPATFLAHPPRVHVTAP